MEQIVATLISALSPSALPIVVCVLGIAYIYWKIQSQRKVSKEERDNQKDELDKRLTLVEHDVTFMKEQNAIFADKLDRILSELTEIKVSLAKKVDVNNK